MDIIKKSGIWMDHSIAHLFALGNVNGENITIESRFTHEEKEESLSKNENLMHNKEQHQQLEFYKKLGEVIRNYDEVLLFGPTNAKVELYNILKADHRFEKIKIEIKSTDKMSEGQQSAFVKEYFSKN